jgi:uncharacterized membrane protein
MREILIQEDVLLVEQKLKEFETRTGCDLLLVIAKESDPYPAAPLRFGVISAFLISLGFSYYLDFHQNFFWPIFFLILTFIFTWVGNFPFFKKFALSSWDTKRETLEKAIEQFHTLGTSQVNHTLTAMIMVSVLERSIQVLVDEKIKEQVSQAELDELIVIMQTHFRAGNMALGFVQSIQSLEDKILKDFGGKVSQAHPSELKDKVIFL